MKILLIIYLVLTVLIILAAIVCRLRRREFKGLNKKEHKFLLFYPLSAVICDIAEKVGKKGADSRIKTNLKRLYVKENVEEEYYVYRVKNLASAIFIVFCCLLLGLLITLSHQGVKYINSLTRGDYGASSKEYVLDVEYGDEEETVAINIDAVKHTEEEILLIFDDSYDAVVEEMLAGNESRENVTGNLNLISEYEEIEISWKIDEPQILDYNGKVSEEIEEGEAALINLYATFSLEGVTEQYTIPIVVRGTKQEEAEELAQSINDAVNELNDPYKSEVNLPGSLDGVSVLFKEITDNEDYIFLLFAIILAIAVVISSGRGLDKKMKARQDEMTLDFTEIVSKLSLLYEAGLSIFKSWERIVEDYEKKGGPPRFAYREMKLTLEKIKGGLSEKQAYSEFGKRCGLHQYIKLGNLLEQNLSKGTKGLKLLLKQEVSEAFDARIRFARKRGEEASTKMLVPMVMMLVIVIVIIAVPALMSMSM